MANRQPTGTPRETRGRKAKEPGDRVRDSPRISLALPLDVHSEVVQRAARVALPLNHFCGILIQRGLIECLAPGQEKERELRQVKEAKKKR